MTTKILNRLKKFGKNERSSFPYWFNHVIAFNLVAIKLGVWRFRFLFHDFEKPWLKLFMKDYKKVQKWHRKRNSHHLENIFQKVKANKTHKADWIGLICDWECSRYTKISSPLTAREELDKLIENGDISKKYGNDTYDGLTFSAIVCKNIYPLLNKLKI